MSNRLNAPCMTMLARTQLCKDQPWSLYNTQLSALHIKLDKHHILPSSTEVSEQVLNSLGGDGHSRAGSGSRDHHSLSPHGEPNVSIQEFPLKFLTHTCKFGWRV